MEAYSALFRIAKLGQAICLKIRDGSQDFANRSGVLLDLTQEGLVLGSDVGVEYISADDVMTWRLPKSDSLVVDHPQGSIASQPQAYTENEPDKQLIIVQENLQIPPKTIEPSTSASEELEILFAGVPILSNPVPSFEFSEIEGGLRKEIDRWHNRYEYAMKIREPARMSQDVAAVADLAEALNNSNLYVLAGTFAYISGLGISRAYSYYEMAAKMRSRPALIALASLAIEKKDWQKAAMSLISAMRIPSESEDNSTLIRTLGQCILCIPEMKLPGLGNILESGLTGSAQRLATNLVAFIVREDSEAYHAAIKTDTEALRRTKIGNDLFSWEKEPPAAFDISKNALPNIGDKIGSRRGRVSAFHPDRNFGFIVEDTTGQPWFFHSSSIEQGSLLTSLLRSEIKQLVAFTGNPSAVSGKYPLANNIEMLSSDGSVMIPERIRAPLKLRLAGVPKDGGSYARAKTAEQLDQLNEAENLYRGEISNNGAHCKSAIKDLAALFNRQGKTEYALELLDKHRIKYTVAEQISLDQMKVQFYVKARRYKDASNLLAILAKQASATLKRVDFLRQEAYCYFADGNFDTAIEKLDKLLKLSPKDSATHLLIGKVKQAKESGSSSNEAARIDESFLEGDEPLASLALGLSVLALRHLEKCELLGVDERSRETHNFSEKDVNQVQRLLQGIKGRKPRDQATYLLTMAVLCNKMPELNVRGGMQRFLMWYFAAMAEAAMSENVNTDVVRCYAIESLLFHSNQEREQIENAWALLLGSYCSDKPEPSILLTKEKDDHGKLLFERFCIRPDDWARFILDAAYYKIKAPLAFHELERHIKKSKLSISLDIGAENKRIREEDSAFHAVASGAFSVDSLRRARETLAQRIQYLRFQFDYERMQEIVRILADITDYVLERHFRERETRFLRLEAEIQRFLNDIDKLPTQLSIEKLSPLISSYLEELRKDFNRASSSQPTIEIHNVLDSDFYTVKDHRVSLRLLLASRDESAPPIEAIDLIVTGYDSEPSHSPEPLHGGQSREIELAVRPSDEQVLDGAFTVSIAVQYRNRRGVMEKIEPQYLAVRLGSVEVEDIPNPYSRYSGGSPVDDEAMFFGRKSLVDRIVQHLSTGVLGQCFVLYGQKRSGKSSVLKQVEKRLINKSLIAALSAGIFNPSNLWGSFASLMIQEVEFQLTDASVALGQNWPTVSDIEQRPIESIRNVSRQVSSFGYRLIVAIDEFTKIYENNSQDIDHFMGGWKALLEAKTFNALLIGQDTMQRFKQAHQNEFGVTHDERLSYLSAEEACNLATQPISFNGESRYRGHALQRLFELTAGSPYFLQIVCDRLVQYLNRQKAPFVTEADIDFIRQKLTVGKESLPPERFDALVTAAGEKVAIVPRQELWTLLTRIARESLHSGWCYRNAISDLPRVEEATKDLVDREVLASEGDRLSIRVGLFASWLRANQ